MKKYVMILVALVALISPVQAEYNPNWWKSLVIEPVPTNDLEFAATRLRQQDRTVWLLDGPEFVAADSVAATNLWNMLAVLHGDLSAFGSACGWR